MRYVSWLLLFAFVFVGCDSLESDDDSEGPAPPQAGPQLVSAGAVGGGLAITATFDQPIDASTLTTGQFRVFSSLDNGRGAQSGFASVTANPDGRSVTLTLRDPGLGNGRHTLRASDVASPDGRMQPESLADFEYRINIQTPTGFIVQKIVVTDFPANKSNGSTWDWDPIASNPRRPDIRVTFQREGRIPLYISNTYDNASSSRDYTFNRAASSDDPNVPFTADYTTEYLLSLVDDDFGGDETMVQARFRFSSKYKLNNATQDEIPVSGQRGFRAVVHGVWVY
ncbi:MAG: hypothetical protein AAGI08_09590 [Bacteroidota bacterium]